MATGTTAFTYDEGADGYGQHCNIKKVTFTWTSTAGGAAADTSRKIVGRIVKAQIVPGSPAPTNGYSCVVTDGNSVNIFANTQKDLTSLSNNTTQERYFLVLDGAGTPLAQSLHPVVADQLTFTIAGAGNAAQGTVTIYYQPM